MHEAKSSIGLPQPQYWQVKFLKAHSIGHEDLKDRTVRGGLVTISALALKFVLRKAP